MKQNKLYNTAIYCRLSLDDGNEGDSSSIKIQKMMLENMYQNMDLLFMIIISMMVIVVLTLNVHHLKD